jgi:1,4-dihydroxy-2-naphthoate octaprenyltransferase
MRITQKMSKIKLILLLARLHFLVLGFLLYSLGYIIAIHVGTQHNLTKFLFGYIVFGTAHLSVSFSNNYFDQKADKNSCQTPFSGGSKILQKHPELQKTTLNIAITLLLISLITNIIFTITYNYTYWFTLFVIAGGFLGYFYTANPIKLSYRGLGEIATMMGVGTFMTGMGYFIAQGQLNTNFFLFAIPLTIYGLFFIITVELPDKECDSLANKKNPSSKIWTKNCKTNCFPSKHSSNNILHTDGNSKNRRCNHRLDTLHCLFNHTHTRITNFYTKRQKQSRITKKTSHGQHNCINTICNIINNESTNSKHLKIIVVREKSVKSF